MEEQEVEMGGSGITDKDSRVKGAENPGFAISQMAISTRSQEVLTL